MDCNHVSSPIAMALDDQGHISSGTGSADGNVNSESTSTLSREPSRIAREENLTDFMRDHPPPMQVIPQEEEGTVVALNDQAGLIRWHYRLQHL
eukprot:5703811-Ditylum_brightwellii.AAC.1